jgi:excisionase family DNA binding protein
VIEADTRSISAEIGAAMPMSELMTVPELAEFLRVNPATIYRLLRDKRIPGFRVGSEWRFDREAIEQWQQEAEHAPSIKKRGRKPRPS